MQARALATSIPKRQRTDQHLAALAHVQPQNFEISYAGKCDVDGILATRSASLSRIWPSDQVDLKTVNGLYFGENLNILANLLKNPSVRGKVQLIYIDPPFATGGIFKSRIQRAAYEDVLVGAHYIEFLRKRLVILRELLAETGSIYVHLDRKMAFAIKMILDEIFGPHNFRSWITRQKCNPKNYTSKTYGNIADFILFYSKGDTYTWHRPTKARIDAHVTKEYRYEDGDGRRYMKVPVHAPGVRNGETGKAWRNKLPPPGKHWQYAPADLDKLDEKGFIYWSPTGNPRRKVYLDETTGVAVQDIWLDFRDAHNQNIKITGFPTEKNPELLKHIISASSSVGDLVLDCFSGSGTTMAVASELGRQWIGIDNSPEAIATTLKRFNQGTSPMGDYVGRPTPQVSRALLLPGVNDRGHESVTDFTFYAEDEVDDGRLISPDIRTQLEALSVSRHATGPV